MKTLRNTHPGMALCAGLFTIAAFAAPASALEIPGDPFLADHAMQPRIMLVEVPVDTIDENGGAAPAAEIPVPVQPERNADELYNKTPKEIIGMDVVDVDGEAVGTVDNLVMDKAISTVSAVIAVDQIMGLVGGKKIVIPLDTLHIRGEALEIALNKDQVKTSPEYVEEYYVPIPEKDERPISDYLASGAKNGGHPA